MTPSVRSLSVDSACAGRNSCRSNRPRHANRHGFLSLLLQCRGKKSSLMETKQLPDDRGKQALLSSFLSYPKEINYICWNWRKKTRPGKASIEGSLSLLSGNHGRNTPQHTPEKTQDSATMHEFQNCCGSKREMSGTQQHKMCTELHINWIADFKSLLATDRSTPTLHPQPPASASWKLRSLLGIPEVLARLGGVPSLLM